MAATHSAMSRSARRPSRSEWVAVRCLWGNLLHCYSPAPERFAGVGLGLVQFDCSVPLGSPDGSARFYREVFATQAVSERNGQAASVTRAKVSVGQALVFTESRAELPAYDGHHLQIYLADFSGPHRRLKRWVPSQKKATRTSTACRTSSTRNRARRCSDWSTKCAASPTPCTAARW